MVKKIKKNLPLKDSWVSLDPMKKIKLLYSTDQVVVMHMKNTFKKKHSRTTERLCATYSHPPRHNNPNGSLYEGLMEAECAL